MGMKSFKIKALSVLTACGLMTTMSGCGSIISESNPDSLLRGTLLEKVSVAKVGDELVFVRERDARETVEGRYDDADIGANGAGIRHYHYFDIVSGEWLTDEARCTNRNVRIVSDIELIESVYKYMTKEEMIKAAKGELSIEDVVIIVTRIRDNQASNSLILTP